MRDRDNATLIVEHFERLRREDRATLSADGARLLMFAARDAGTHDVRVTRPR